MSDEKPKSNWVASGLFFGASMFLFLYVILPLVQGEPIPWVKGIVICVLVGLLFGYTMTQIKPRK